MVCHCWKVSKPILVFSLKCLDWTRMTGNILKRCREFVSFTQTIYLIIHTDFVVGRGIQCGIEFLFFLCNLCLSSWLIEGASKVRVLVLCLVYKLVIIIFQEDKSLLLPWMIFTLSFLVFYSACAFMGSGHFVVFFVILVSWLCVSFYW